MDLVTEYYQRHSVQTPLIRYAPMGNLILRKKNSCCLDGKYEVITINFTNKDGTPGSFQFTTFAPVHNGYRANRNLMVCTNDVRIIWDDYEDYVHKLVNLYKGRVVALCDKDEMKVACWEMSLLAYDSVFAELPLYYLETFYMTIDYSLRLPDRLAQIDLAVDNLQNCEEQHLASHVKLFNQAWGQAQRYMESYSHWLGKLFNKSSVELAGGHVSLFA